MRLKVPFKVSKREEAIAAVSKSYWKSLKKIIKQKEYVEAVNKLFELNKLFRNKNEK